MSTGKWFIYVNFEQAGSLKRESIRLSETTAMKACDTVKLIWKGEFDFTPHIPKDKYYIEFYDWNIRNVSIYNTEKYEVN